MMLVLRIANEAMVLAGKIKHLGTTAAPRSRFSSRLVMATDHTESCPP